MTLQRRWEFSFRQRDRYTGKSLDVPYKYARPCPATLQHHTWTKKGGLFTDPPTHPHGQVQQYYNSSTTAEAARTVLDPSNHPHVQQRSSTCSSRTWVRWCRGSCCIVLEFPFFCDLPPYRGPGTAPFDVPRKARSRLRHVLSPIRPCAAVWGRPGEAAQPRAARWCSGEPSQNGAYRNRHNWKHPTRSDDDYCVSALI